MSNNHLITYRKLAVFLYATGIILGLLFMGGTIWADFEASMFDTTLPANWADTTLQTLKCPLIISSQETGKITASFTNDTEKEVNLRVRLHITDGLVTMISEENTILPIAPGETEYGEWIVYPEDATWGHFILVRVYQFRAYKIPSRSTSCGVLLVDLFNFTGSQLLILLITTSLLFMIGGVFLFIKTSKTLRNQTLSLSVAMILMILLIIAGGIFSFLGSWIIGAGFLLIIILLLVALIPFIFREQQI